MSAVEAVGVCKKSYKQADKLSEDDDHDNTDIDANADEHFDEESDEWASVEAVCLSRNDMSNLTSRPMTTTMATSISMRYPTSELLWKLLAWVEKI